MDEDAGFDFDAFGTDFVAGQCLRAKDDLKVRAASFPCGDGFKQPLNIVDVVYVAVEVDIAASSAKCLRIRDLMAFPT